MPDAPPSDAPPSYEAATGSRAPAQKPSTTGSSTLSSNNPFLSVPSSSQGGRSSIPTAHRRSMEDEARPLPQGWVRQYDAGHEHQFFVDTTRDPPRSIWHHPYDDEEYLATLSSAERERVHGVHTTREPSHADLMAESTDEEDESHLGPPPGMKTGAPAGTGDREANPKGLKKFGRHLKDKVTSSTHEERVKERARRAEEEQRMYEQHLALRRAMVKAMETGQPQLIGKDHQGKDVYIEPPQAGYGGSFGDQYGTNYNGYSPYANGPYGNPNSRYLRPDYGYNRPYGYGYGGGLGVPLLGGLAGGLLLGSII